VTQRLNPNAQPTELEEFEDTDCRVKYCKRCNHCYERKKSITPWEREKTGFYEYYKDFPTIGKARTDSCPKCSSIEVAA